MILGMGIGGFIAIVCCFGVLLNIVAVIMGHQDLAAMKDGRMDPDGHGLTLAGVIIAWIGIGINVLAIGINILAAIAQG